MMVAKMEGWRISDERTSMVDILLKANADLNTQKNVRLQYQNMYSIVHATPTITVSFNLSSQSTGWTALKFAVNEGHKDIVQRLVSAGADVNIRDKVCSDIESVCHMVDVVPNGLEKVWDTNRNLSEPIRLQHLRD